MTYISSHDKDLPKILDRPTIPLGRIRGIPIELDYSLTLPAKTILAFADLGREKDVLPVDGGDADETLVRFAKVGVDQAALAAQLQRKGTQLLVKSCIALVGSRNAETAGEISTGTCRGRFASSVRTKN